MMRAEVVAVEVSSAASLSKCLISVQQGDQLRSDVNKVRCCVELPIRKRRKSGTSLSFLQLPVSLSTAQCTICCHCRAHNTQQHNDLTLTPAARRHNRSASLFLTAQTTQTMQHSTPGLMPGLPSSATTNGTRPTMPPQPYPYSVVSQHPTPPPSTTPTSNNPPPHPHPLHPQPHPGQQPPQPASHNPATAFNLHSMRLTRSIQNVFTQASAMLLSEDPNASQLFEQLEQLTIASDQSLLYLIDTDALLQMESANVYPASLPLSMSSTREEYWRSAYDTMRLQWGVMDKVRSRHDILKQAAADFWPAPPQPSPAPVSPPAESLDTQPSPAAQSVKQDEQMDDGGAAVQSSSMEVLVNDTHTAALDGQPPLPTTEHVDLTQSTTDNTTPTPDPMASQQPASDTTQPVSSDVMTDTQLTPSPQPAYSSPVPPAILLTPPPQQSQQLTPVLPPPVESPSHQLDRPEPIEAARSVMDLTDDL